jgi:S-layer homology domain.
MKKISLIVIVALLFVNLSLSIEPATAESNAAENILNGSLATSNTTGFKDTKGHWAEAAIKTAVEKGYVSGYTDGTFKPDATITGEEFITMMVKALQYPVQTPSSGDSWFAPYKQAATSHELYKNDYVSGLNKPISRGEIASTIVRATQSPMFEQKIKEEMQILFPIETFANDSVRKSIEAGPDFTGDFNLIYDHPEQVIADLKQALASVKKRNPPQLMTNTDECKKDENMCAYLISNEQNDIENMLENVQEGLDPILKLKSDQTSSKNRMIYEAALRGLMTGTTPGELSIDSKVTRAQAVTFINRVVAFNNGERFQTNKYTVAAAELMWHRTNILTMLPRYFSSPIEGQEIDPNKLVSTSGTLTCSVDQFVVVDMDDKNDPNRKYVTDDLYWGRLPDLFQVNSGSGYYAVLSISKLTVTNGSKTSVGPCVAEIANDDWSPTASTIDPKNPTGRYGIINFNPEKKEIKRTVTVTQGTPTYHTTGSILPKGNFTSKNSYRITYTPLGSDAMSGQIYSSLLNEKYNQ